MADPVRRRRPATHNWVILRRVQLIGYIRVSRVAGREGESFISPAAQRDRIAQLAAAHGHTVVDWLEDLDQPGSRVDRPGFQAAIEAVEQGRADGIAVARLDRFARSVAGALESIQRLNAVDGHLVIGDLGVDTSTPAGKLTRNVLLALAEFELDRIRDGWEDAKSRAVGRGVHIASRVPAGYRRRDDGRLEPDPRDADHVREVFLRRAAGASWAELAAFLNARGVTTHLGGDWTGDVITRMIRRRVYLGEARQGLHVNPGAHEPLVTPVEWQAAQRPQPTGVRAASEDSGGLLSGVVRCASCSYRLKPWPRRRHGRRWLDYRCRKRHGGGVCPDPVNVGAEALDQLVAGMLLDRYGQVEGAPVASDREAQAARAAVDEAQAEIDAYLVADLVSVVGAEAFRAGLAPRAEALEEALARLAAVDRSRDVPAGVDATGIASGWPSFSLAEKRQVVAAAVDAVFVRRHRSGGFLADRVAVRWAGEGPEGLSGPGRLGVVRRFVFPDELPVDVGVAVAEDAE